MNRAELVKALKRLKVQTGSLACLGCGREHNCSMHGCAIIRAAVEAIPPTSLNIGDSVWFVGLDDDTWVICKEKSNRNRVKRFLYFLHEGSIHT